MQTVKTILKFLRGLIITLVVMYGVVMLLLTVPQVQHYVSVATQEELGKLLDTRVAIGHITVGYPNRLILDNVELDDRSGKRVLQAARLSARSR